MTCSAILVAFAVLVAQQPRDDRPDSGVSKDRDPQLQAPVRIRRDLIPDQEGLPISDPKEYAKGVARGRAEADGELKSKKAKIWSYGLVVHIFTEPVDRETGLYFTSFGCSIDDEIIGRVEGHNARIAESIREHGLPKNSFKPWEKELFGLAEYFERRSRTAKPTRLTVGGPAVRSPDGKFVVKLVERRYEVPAELKIQPAQRPCILVGEQETESNRIWFPPNDPELIWGPEGSWFAVLKGKTSKGDRTVFEAIDLRDMRTIRDEFGKDSEPK